MIDNRRVQNPNTKPFDAIVAIDATFATTNFNGVGSGIVIAPSHILTAGHVVYNNAIPQNARVLLSTDVATLANPRINYVTNAAGNLVSNNTPVPANINVTAAPLFPLNFPTNTGNFSTDIALLTTQTPLTTEQNSFGMVVFLDPEDIDGAPITTAGYPATFSDGTQDSRTDDNTGRTLYSAKGKVHDVIGKDTRISYTEDVDTQGGQSGSGVWYDGDLFGENAQLVAAIHTLGVNNVFSNTDGTNSGVLISKEIYDSIIGQIEADSGTANANALPENTIVGSEPGFFSFITGSGDDNIVGSYRKERIIGQGGDDTLIGGGANDRLEGGDGVDQALFSDIFTNYDFTITDPSNPAFEFSHTDGTQSDGKDTTKDIEFGVFEFVDVIDKNGNRNPDGQDDDGNLFFVPLQVDPDDNTKLKDGPKITPDEDIFDNEGNKIGTITVESPAWMFDGDVNYTLTIGSEQGILFNFAYIIDTSGSMSGTPLAETKAAYQALTQSLIDDGIAGNSEFAVVPFNSSASLNAPLDAAGAISTINGLSAGGGTNFGPALTQAQNFFTSPARNNNATNIAYFLSDGFGFGANTNLQSVAEVRAFGIGNADLSSLNIIDSDNAVLLANPADLVTEFNAATVDRDTIERIDVKLAGKVVDTITPDQLIEDTLGLKFEGTIDGLEVTREAENEITFDVVFNNGNPTASLDYKITTGQEQLKDKTDDGTKEVIIFSVNQADFTDAENQSINKEIIGNDLDNTIEVQSGENTIFGNGGNDRFILSGGINLVDGGEGIDTVEIDKTQGEAGGVSKTGNIVNIGTDNTLLNVEFIEFSDVRLAVDTLSVSPILSLANKAILIDEGDSGSTVATFSINLSSVTTEDVVINFATRSNDANAGVDFTETTGQLTISAGESSGEIAVEVLGDTDIEGDEAVFLDLNVVSGGTFANGAMTEIAGVNILDNDSRITLPFTGLPVVSEGNPGENSNELILTLERFGGLNGSDTIEVEIVSAGDNPAQASDFVDGFFTRQVTFAPGEDTKTIDIAITGDQKIEDDETFGVRLKSVSGSALVPTEDILFTILDEDDDNKANLTSVSGIRKQQDEDNVIIFAAADFINAFNDADGDSLSKIQITSLPENGTLKLGDTAVTLGQEIEVAELSNLTFTPVTDFTGNTSFGWNGSDGTIYADQPAKVELNIQPLFRLSQSDGIFQPNKSASAQIQVRWLQSPTRNYEFGFIPVDDANGGLDTDGDGIIDINPDDPNYQTAALNRKQAIFNGNQSNSNNVLTRENAQGDFIVSEGQSITQLQSATLITGFNIFYLSDDTQTTFSTDNNSQNLGVSEGTGYNQLQFTDSQGEAVSFELSPTPVLVTPGNSTNRVQAEISLSRIADFENTIGLYAVDNLTGGIDINGDRIIDFKPGDIGYSQAAVERAVTFSAPSNGGTSSTTVDLQGGQVLGLFLIADADVNNFLSQNPDNKVDGGPLAYFSFTEANPDNKIHVMQLGSGDTNIFGFEDQFSGGDQDFNDIIASVTYQNFI